MAVKNTSPVEYLKNIIDLIKDYFGMVIFVILMAVFVLPPTDFMVAALLCYEVSYLVLLFRRDDRVEVIKLVIGDALISLGTA